MNRKLETLQTIIDRAEPFLKEAPRKNWVKLRTVDGIEALLFYNVPSQGAEGTCLQFLHKDYCYCFSKTNEARWEEVTNGTNPASAFMKEILI